MDITTSETIEIKVDSRPLYRIEREHSGVISVVDLNCTTPGGVCFLDRDVLETFILSLQRVKRF